VRDRESAAYPALRDRSAPARGRSAKVRTLSAPARNRSACTQSLRPWAGSLRSVARRLLPSSIVLEKGP
jgi:hypothetical protein